MLLNIQNFPNFLQEQQLIKPLNSNMNLVNWNPSQFSQIPILPVKSENNFLPGQIPLGGGIPLPMTSLAMAPIGQGHSPIQNISGPVVPERVMTRSAKRRYSNTAQPQQIQHHPTLSQKYQDQISSEARLNNAELEKLMRPLPGNVNMPFTYQEDNLNNFSPPASEFQMPLSRPPVSKRISTSPVNLDKPKFSRPAMRRNKLKRDFQPFRDRVDYSHIKCPKERRRLRSLDNARLYRDKEKQRIMTLEGGIEYFHDHNTRLQENNIALEKAISLLEEYMSKQAEEASRQCQQIVNQDNQQVHNQQVHNQHHSTALSSIENVQQTNHLNQVLGSTAPSAVSSDQNSDLTEITQLIAQDQTQTEFSAASYSGLDLPSNRNNCLEQPTLPNLDVNESDIVAMSEEYRINFRETDFNVKNGCGMSNIENILEENPENSNLDQHQDQNQEPTTSKIPSINENSKSSSGTRNKLGLSLDLTKLNSSGKSSNATSSTMKTIIEKNPSSFEDTEIEEKSQVTQKRDKVTKLEEKSHSSEYLNMVQAHTHSQASNAHTEVQLQAHVPQPVTSCSTATFKEPQSAQISQPALDQTQCSNISSQFNPNNCTTTNTTIGSIGEPLCSSSMIQHENLVSQPLSGVSGYGSAEPSPADILAKKNLKLGFRHFAFGGPVGHSSEQVGL